MNLGIALRGALVIVLVGSALGLAHNALSPEPVPWKPAPRTTVSLDDLAPEDPGASGGTAAGGGEAFRDDPDAGAAGAGAVSRDDPDAGTAGEAVAAEHPDHAEAFETKASGEPVETAPAAANPGLSAADYSDIPESEFPIEVSLSRAKTLYDRGGLLVLDAREVHEYAAGHIKGAEVAPYDVMVGDLEWLERTAADPRPVLVYCDGTDCELSLNLGFEISQSGHRRVLVLESGYSSWSDAGYPTATGDRP